MSVKRNLPEVIRLLERLDVHYEPSVEDMTLCGRDGGVTACSKCAAIFNAEREFIGPLEELWEVYLIRGECPGCLCAYAATKLLDEEGSDDNDDADHVSEL